MNLGAIMSAGQDDVHMCETILRRSVEETGLKSKNRTDRSGPVQI